MLPIAAQPRQLSDRALSVHGTRCSNCPQMQSEKVYPYISVHLSIADLPEPFIVGCEVSGLEALTTYGNWSDHSLSGPDFLSC